MSEQRERLAQVMQAHSRDGRKSYLNVVCVCGWSGTSTDHYLHIAAAILAAGFGDVAHTVSTVAEMDALPVGSIVKGAADGEVIVGRKPHVNDYPNAVNSFWETVGSELGTDAESILWDGPALVLHVPSTTDTNGATLSDVVQPVVEAWAKEDCLP